MITGEGWGEACWPLDLSLTLRISDVAVITGYLVRPPDLSLDLCFCGGSYSFSQVQLPLLGSII